jgi:energy-coupling factor transporter ATP-binding protein EcfA2/GNAT superfamily N-acetyltransferase
MTIALPARDSRLSVPPVRDGFPSEAGAIRSVLSRSVVGDRSEFKLSDGTTLVERRFLPLGQGDLVAGDGETLAVLAKRDDQWVGIGSAWSSEVSVDLAGIKLQIKFKEIEDATELKLFQQLRQFHYRGGGGAGRTLPLIGTVNTPDLPRVIGFVELTSAMIANTARKRFFDSPYREPDGLGWSCWDHSTSRELSSLVCRISRFVIHPELRGLGLARHFASAAIELAQARWHYGGYRPRFLEITADMLRFYPFVSADFAFVGETEGNEHRVSKDMSYLVKRALSEDGVKAMPQGGGGIMSLQRGYATTLLDYIRQTGSSLEEAVAQLQYDPSKLDQLSWEKLHRLNRRPKPCYVAGLTDTARAFVRKRALQLSVNTRAPARHRRLADHGWQINHLRVEVEADIVQTKQGRLLQDAFGFVGSAIKSTVVPSLDLRVEHGEITLICGASGSGKSLFLAAAVHALQRREDSQAAAAPNGLQLRGDSDNVARVAILQRLDPAKAPLELLGSVPLSKMLMLAARCGLAEPQLLVRPIWTLSSGQQYRLQIALALLQDPEIIVIDNFCEALDRFSTRAVCKGVTTLVRQLNISALLATAAYDRLGECLEPDQLVMLRRGDEPVIQKAVRLEI